MKPGCRFVLSFIACFFMVLPAAAQAPHHSRKFEFTYDVTLTHLPATAKEVRVWIPLASSGAHQNIRIEKMRAPVSTRITREPVFGNRMLYAEIHHPRSSIAEFRIRYIVTRREYSKGNHASLMNDESHPAVMPVSLTRFLEPDRLVPTDGLIAQIAQEETRGKQGNVSKAWALYNYVFHHMRYDKSGAGWGHGDALWACDARHGNCTDFHSLFIALARAVKIPARFDIGFPLPPNSRQGSIPGYHCWAEFYIPGSGWAPVDISEAWLTPALHDFYFGSIDASRVRFSTGRDLILSPRQSGPPVNYFVYPYIEVDGKPFDSMEKKFSFHELSLAGSASSGR